VPVWTRDDPANYGPARSKVPPRRADVEKLIAKAEQHGAVNEPFFKAWSQPGSSSAWVDETSTRHRRVLADCMVD
jgi:hypothetical protein